MLPAIAVVVVAYRSAGDLPETLRLAREQLAPGDDLIVVDNASPDDDAAVARATVPEATVLERTTNDGFGAGCNAGAATSSAPLLVFLNPDARLAPGALDALRSTAAERPGWGAWQALVLLPGATRVNTSGGVIHWLGLAWAGQCDEPAPAAPAAPAEVGFASGAALVVRRAAWEQVGGFEPRYFMYGEDVDLSLRLRLAGWGVGVVPAARVEHHYEFVKGDYKWQHLERNRWWTLLTTYPAPLLALVAPALLAAELALLAVAARGGWLRAKLRANAAVILTMPWILRRRRAVQATRRIGAAELAATALSASLESPYLDGIARVAPLRALQAGYWAVVRRLLRATEASR